MQFPDSKRGMTVVEYMVVGVALIAVWSFFLNPSPGSPMRRGLEGSMMDAVNLVP